MFEIEESFHDRKVKELRDASGKIESNNPIVEFLYELMRDHLPVGIVEELVLNIEKHREDDNVDDNYTLYTNGFLAKYALNLAERLKK